MNGRRLRGYDAGVLPFFYRMVRYVPAVGATKVMETLPVHPVGKQLPQEKAPLRENKIPAPPDRFLPSSPSTQPPSSEPYHVGTLWGDRAPNWSETPQRILVASDNTEVSQPAIQAGRDLAARFNATVEIRHFEGSSREIAQKILRSARDSAASLLVLGSHGRTGKLRVKEGSVAETVMKEAECSVLLVPVEIQWEKIKRILIPIGSGSETFRGIALGTWLAHRLQSEVFVLHLSENEASIPASFQKFMTYIQSLEWKKLEETQGLGPQGIADTIVDLAKQNSVDLILMGSHQEIIHDQLLPSSVCLEVLRQTVHPLWIHPLAHAGSSPKKPAH